MTVVTKAVVCVILSVGGARCSSMVRAFAHGAMGRQIDPSWGGPTDCLHCNFNDSQSAA